MDCVWSQDWSRAWIRDVTRAGLTWTSGLQLRDGGRQLRVLELVITIQGSKNPDPALALSLTSYGILSLDTNFSRVNFFFFNVDYFKVFIEFVTTLLLFYGLDFSLQGVWDLGSLTRDWTHTPCIGRRSLKHWAAREVPVMSGLNSVSSLEANSVSRLSTVFLKKHSPTQIFP